jgi:hypothetical protein
VTKPRKPVQKKKPVEAEVAAVPDGIDLRPWGGPPGRVPPDIDLWPEQDPVTKRWMREKSEEVSAKWDGFLKEACILRVEVPSESHAESRVNVYQRNGDYGVRVHVGALTMVPPRQQRRGYGVVTEVVEHIFDYLIHFPLAEVQIDEDGLGRAVVAEFGRELRIRKNK